jgi:hypothetical protein
MFHLCGLISFGTYVIILLTQKPMQNNPIYLKSDLNFKELTRDFCTGQFSFYPIYLSS